MPGTGIHILFSGQAGLRCTCSEVFRDDSAAAIQHLRTATVLGEEAVPEPTKLVLALAKANTSARAWVGQAHRKVLDWLHDEDFDVNRLQLRNLRDDLYRAAFVLEDPEADDRLPDKKATPHTTPTTINCLRCGTEHSVSATKRLNEKEGLA